MLWFIQNNQDAIGNGSQEGGGSKKQTNTNTKPLKVLVKRYSTKKYRRHQVEEVKVHFYRNDSSSSDEDDGAAISVEFWSWKHINILIIILDHELCYRNSVDKVEWCSAVYFSVFVARRLSRKKKKKLTPFVAVYLYCIAVACFATDRSNLSVWSIQDVY